MNELSKFTNPANIHVAAPDPTIDFILYLTGVLFGYYLFKTSLVFSALYIERMGIPIYRRITKIGEYGCMLASGYLILGAVTTYQSLIYYCLDVILVILLAHTFIKGDQALRGEYLHAHQSSKQKTVNRLIVNLGNSMFGQDN
ncbi:hypothetical protein [Spirosoma lituiforme]